MSDERMPHDILVSAAIVAVDVGDQAIAEDANHTRRFSATKARNIIARAILAERNRVHKQLKGEGK